MVSEILTIVFICGMMWLIFTRLASKPDYWKRPPVKIIATPYFEQNKETHNCPVCNKKA